MIPQPISYQITGETYQTLEVTLNPGETIVAEAGTMVFMDDGISYETCLGDGSEHRSGRAQPRARRARWGHQVPSGRRPPSRYRRNPESLWLPFSLLPLRLTVLSFFYSCSIPFFRRNLRGGCWGYAIACLAVLYTKSLLNGCLR